MISNKNNIFCSHKVAKPMYVFIRNCLWMTIFAKSQGKSTMFRREGDFQVERHNLSWSELMRGQVSFNHTEDFQQAKQRDLSKKMLPKAHGETIQETQKVWREEKSTKLLTSSE